MQKREKIRELLVQLDGLGYHSFQVKEIIQETVGTTRLETLTEAEEANLVETLEEYVQFALKCRTV